MDHILIKCLSKEPHLSQALTGFYMLFGRRRCKVEDHSEDPAYPYHTAILDVEYKNRKIIYDMMDGYQYPEAIKYYLQQCDYYFKRSYSEEKNKSLGLPCVQKMYPYGFNYHVSCRNHPLDKSYIKESLKAVLRLPNDQYNNKSTYYNSERFEEQPQYKTEGVKVLFMARLWEPDDMYSTEVNEERKSINRTRIAILRELKKNRDINFVGGVSDSEYAEENAPDLIMPGNLTYRKNYIHELHSSDICIGSMGLHESIGWKTGEYIAAAKAIINEKFHYEVPGDFMPGRNYLEYQTVAECLQAVSELAADPDKLYAMKKQNQIYYNKYLKPDMLIKNTLEIVDQGGASN